MEEEEVKKDGFLMLQKEFMNHYLSLLRPESVHLYIYLANFINKKLPASERFAWPGMDKILEDLKTIKSKNTILKAISELFEYGLIHAIIPIRDVETENGKLFHIIKGFKKVQNCPNAYYINMLDEKDLEFIGSDKWEELNSMTLQRRKQKSKFFKDLALKRKPRKKKDVEFNI